MSTRRRTIRSGNGCATSAEVLGEARARGPRADPGRRHRALFQGADRGARRRAADPGGCARSRCAARLQSEGVRPLYAELARRDPQTASRLMPNDRSRIARALEVVLATGRSLSDWHREGMPALIDAERARRCSSLTEREELVARIETRFAAMLASRRAGGGAGARRAATRSVAAGDEGAWRALADPPSRRRDLAGRGGGRRHHGHPPLRQAPAHLVPQPDEGLALGPRRKRPKRRSKASSVSR